MRYYNCFSSMNILKYIVLLIFLTGPIQYGFESRLGSIQPHVIILILGLIFALPIILMGPGNKKNRYLYFSPSAKYNILTLLFIISLSFASVFSPLPQLAIPQLLQYILIFLVLYLLLSYSYSNLDDFSIFLNGLIIVGTIIASIGSLEVFFGPFIYESNVHFMYLEGMTYPRPRFPFLNSTQFAIFMGVCLIVVLEYIKLERHLLLKIFISIILLIGILLSFSRGAILSFIGAYTVLKAIKSQNVYRNLVILPLVLIFTFFTIRVSYEMANSFLVIPGRVGQFIERFLMPFNEGINLRVSLERLGMIQEGITYFFKRPLFGWGANGYLQIKSIELSKLTSVGLHNQIATLGVSGGLVGLFWYLSILLYHVKIGVVALKKLSFKFRQLTSAYLGILLFFCFESLVHDVLIGYLPALLVLSIVALQKAWKKTFVDNLK